MQGQQIHYCTFPPPFAGQPYSTLCQPCVDLLALARQASRVGPQFEQFEFLASSCGGRKRIYIFKN